MRNTNHLAVQGRHPAGDAEGPQGGAAVEEARGEMLKARSPSRRGMIRRQLSGGWRKVLSRW
jgi:hypothetical protein